MDYERIVGNSYDDCGPYRRGRNERHLRTCDPKGFSWRGVPNSGQKAGGASFIELNVLVPVENLIGKENEGFRIIMTNFNKVIVSSLHWSWINYSLADQNVH